ncbi:MAG: hypothetical protein DHS20C05_16780 [Hyphococcus sp.]|nr:MAG: hypothetical protein DHS20C05_16780 [Marinicaulis sp.]
MDISRRTLLLTSGAAAAFPATTFASQGRPEFIAWHDQGYTSHQAKLTEFGTKGYRTSSLSFYGTPDRPLIAAVMIKRPVVHAEQQRVGINLQQAISFFSEMAQKGMYPYLLSAIGSVDEALYAISVMPMNVPSKPVFAVTGRQLLQENKKAFDQGRKLISIDAFGSKTKTTYTAIWSGDKSIDGWNHATTRQNQLTLKQHEVAHASVGARANLMAITPEGNYLTYFSDAQRGETVLRTGLTSAGYQRAYSQEYAKGFFPYKVAATGAGADIKFAAIFTKTETETPRVFNSTGLRKVPRIDNIIETFMRRGGARGASLAISKDRKLLYARSYSFAEPNHPIHNIDPNTYFRIGSVSKTLTLLGFYKFMELAASDGGEFSLDTRVQSILSLAPISDNRPIDSRFSKLTVRHLIDSTGGLEKEGNLWASAHAAKQLNVPLPISAAQLAQYIATRPLEHEPGQKGKAKYGNVSYFILGLVLSRLMGVRTLEDALRTLIFNQIGVKRIRTSHSLLSEQAPDEAFYFAPALGVGASTRSADRPVTPSHYGVWDMENIGGAGGLSATMPDLARIGACLSGDNPNLIFSADHQRGSFFMAALTKAAITSAGGSRGYSGFDKIHSASNQPGHYKFEKGGRVPGAQASLSVDTHGYTIAFAYSGNSRQGVSNDWQKRLLSQLQVTDLGSDDLFPAYGMNSI